MIEDQKKFIFPSDPFRENPQYTLSINPGTVVRNHVEDEKAEHEAKIEEKGERTLRGILRDAARQIIASLIILVMGFFALNWSAYYQIAKNKIDGYRGVLNQQDMVGVVKENDNEEEFKEVLSASADIEVQKNQIPDLNMEIVPIDTRLIIPRINQNLPIVGVSSKNLIEKNWNALEKDMQEALKDGVIHYPGTSYPGQKGNVVITGHSSYFPWDSGRFKDVFALLHQLKIGDKITIYHNQEKYIYEVSETKIVLPSDIDILKQTPEERLTLITCTPVGTNLKRLIVIAKPVLE